MTRELIEALFRDDIFVCGVNFGALIGFIICFVINCIDDYFIDKLFKRKDKEK